jgi:hypothetical protein
MTSNSSPSASSWVPLVQFGNWADLGYFESVLHENDVPTEIRQHEQLSAQDGRRTVSILLMVPAELLERATDILADEVEATSDGDASEDWTRSTPSDPWGPPPEDRFPGDEPAGISLWKPVLVLLVAGGLSAYFLHRQPPARPAPAIDPQENLWHALSELERPLTTAPSDHGTSRRLWYDPNSRTLNLEEDFNGDGRYDRRRKFHPSRSPEVHWMGR